MANFRKSTVLLPPNLDQRVQRLRELACIGAARPSESGVLVDLITRGLDALEAELALEPIPATEPRKAA